MHLSRSESISTQLLSANWSVVMWQTGRDCRCRPWFHSCVCFWRAFILVEIKSCGHYLESCKIAGMSSPKLRGVAVCIVCVAGRIFVSKSHPAQHHHPALPRQPGGCLCCCCCCFGTIQGWILLPAGILCSCSRNQRYGTLRFKKI